MKLFLGILSICLLVTTGYARGTESSGGGPSIRCQREPGINPHAYVYDLVEGRLRYGLKLAEHETSVVDQAKRTADALAKLRGLDAEVGDFVENRLRVIESTIAYLPDGYYLSNPHDLGNDVAPIVPEGCVLMYGAYFEKSGIVRISKSLTDLMTGRDKAALLMHEALYAVARERSGQTDSQSIRLVNAFIFSETTNASPEVFEALETLRSATTAPQISCEVEVFERQLDGSNRMVESRKVLPNSTGYWLVEAEGYKLNAGLMDPSAGNSIENATFQMQIVHPRIETIQKKLGDLRLQKVGFAVLNTPRGYLNWLCRTD
ncbi:MAG: hypothetical protein EOP06_03040 [Proteobacteria bacterium]|nr:MAG: hypothetical protein EOP06_03040 [Pseudomonadota bacterium]